MMRADLTLRAIACDSETLFSLPRELITTDRVLQRWAVSIGMGMPSEEWDEQLRAKPPPLPDDVAIDVDQCILSSPDRTREVITRWYKTPQPAEVIARKLRVSARNLYRYHGIALNFIRWKFEGCGNVELLYLIRAIDN